MSIKGPERVLICGLGSIGSRYCMLIREKWPSVKVGAVRSMRRHRTGSAESQRIDEVFYSLDEALRWVPNAVIICTPANLHLQQAHYFANKGIPTLIEKPIGTGEESQSDWLSLLRLQKTTPIYVGYVLRQDPCVDYAKKAICEGKMGKLISADFFCGSWLPDWRPGTDYREKVSSQKRMGGGVLLELSHEIDLAQYLFGEIEPVFSSLRNASSLETDTEDFARLVMRAKNELTIGLNLDFCTKPPRRLVTIRGEEGELSWDLIDGKISMCMGLDERVCLEIGLSVNERFINQLSEFWRLPSTGQSKLCSIEDGVKVLGIINKARAISIS